MKHNIYSNTKIFGHPDKIASFRKGVITAPIYVRIKPTNRCMHACHWCVYSDGHQRPKDRPELHLQSHMHESMRERDEMPAEKLRELIDDLASMGTRAITFSGGGEPLGYPGIEGFMHQAISRGLEISVITNGQALSGRAAQALHGANWVRVSMDYANAEQMTASRNVPQRFFDQVIANLRDFAAEKPQACDLGINFIVTRENYHDLFLAAKLLKEVGVENVRFSPVYCSEFQRYHAPLAEEVENHLAVIQGALVDSSFTVNSFYDLTSESKKPSHHFARCLYAQTVPVVGADLNVYACHNTAYTEHGRLGSIAHRSFRDLWHSEEMKRAQSALCPAKVCNHECANHAKVALFEELASQPTDNFV